MTGFEESSIPRTRRHTRMLPPRRTQGDALFGFPVLPHLTPRAFPGLAFWVRADTWSGPHNSTVGQFGREWNDSSMHGLILGRNDPILPRFHQRVDGNMPAMWLDAAGSRLIMPSVLGTRRLLSLSGDFTFVTVYKQDAANDGQFFSHHGLNRQLRVNRGNANRNSYYDGVVEVISDVIPVSQTAEKMWVVRRLGTSPNNIIHRVNKTACGGGSSNTTLELNLLGGSNFGNAYAGWIFEIAIYLRALTLAQIDLLYTYYLRPRYGALPIA